MVGVVVLLLPAVRRVPMQRFCGMTSAGHRDAQCKRCLQYCLFLLFLEDPDLLLEILDDLPEFPVDAIGQTGDECDPQLLFHSLERLMDRPSAGKCSRQGMMQVNPIEVLRLGGYLYPTGETVLHVETRVQCGYDRGGGLLPRASLGRRQMGNPGSDHRCPVPWFACKIDLALHSGDGCLNRQVTNPCSKGQ